MTYYRSIEELETPAQPHDIDDGRSEVDRRDFLKLAGFSLAAVAVSGCQRPLVESAVPYLTAPEEIVPGRAYWMASTCHGCPARCGVLVKCRDGRPIKIEGNPDHPVSRGGLCAVGQAVLLGLYDSQRLAAPRIQNVGTDWASVDRFVGEKLSGARSVRVVSSTIPSPTTTRAIADFLSRFPDGKHVVYDVLSCSAIADAHKETHGVRAIPRYDFSSADVVVSFDADFLGTWISPVEFTKEWAARRSSTTPQRPWHTQLEARMSLTGGKADQRLRLHPHDVHAVLTFLAERVARVSSPAPSFLPESAGEDTRATQGKQESAGEDTRATQVGQPAEPALPFKPLVLDRIVDRLNSTKGRSLVISSSRRLEDQIVVNQINEALGNYGSTIDIVNPSNQRQGNDRDLSFLVADLREGKVDALFALECNPVYDLPEGDEVAKLLSHVPLVVSFASHVDETAKRAHVIAPDHHPLESWHDSEPVAGLYAVTQPTVAPLRNTRAAVESFAAWSGKPARAYDLIRANAKVADWDRTLNDGFARTASDLLPAGEEPAPSDPERSEGESRGGRRPDEGRASTAILPSTAPLTRRFAPPSPGGRGNEVPAAFTVVLYPTIAQLDGRHAHNAWLHELPDPITKVTWDNYACISPETAKRLGVTDGDIVRLNVSSREGEERLHGNRTPDAAAPQSGALEIPAFVQPGQHDQVIAIALGYGRTGTDRFAKIGPKWLLQRSWVTPGETVGKRAVQLTGAEVSIAKTGRTYDLATTQLHSTMDGRHPVEEISPTATPDTGQPTPENSNLWPEKAKGPHQWALAIDLARCTGCSACVIGCQAENNVPVVGKDEVVREREMHWIRIDRYYEGQGDDTRVLHQPVMCQHCGNAPCETVCPVLATVHSSDGLNQQVYNRCVGTRYCANNCPYKARRFNWFDYPHEDRLANLALNPDVTVRSRGVMEKCSMCVQRIEEARIVAKQRGIPIADGAIRTACEQSCPADAIVFGDLQNPKSRITAARRDPRHYLLLEELNVRPAVGYLASLVNPDPERSEGKGTLVPPRNA